MKIINISILILVFINQFNFAFSQKNKVSELFSDISVSKIIAGDSTEKNYHSFSGIEEFDMYLYNKKDSMGDTFHSIALMKSNKIIGALTSCKGCIYYSTIALTSHNPFYPELAKSTKQNGYIDFAKFKTSPTNNLFVGDDNGDFIIDYAFYSISKQWYAVITFHGSLFSPQNFLIYDAFSQEYIGIITFKSKDSSRTFDKVFVKQNQNWDSYSLAGSDPVFLGRTKESDIINGKLPQFDTSTRKVNQTINNEVPRSKEIEFINLMKRTYSITLKNWLSDYKTIINSEVIGLRFPKVITLRK